MRPSIPIRPSSAIDKSVNSRDLWEAFSEYCSNTIDVQYRSFIIQIISNCIEYDYYPEDFLVFDLEQCQELAISHGMWCRIKGAITLFRRLYKKDLAITKMEDAASTLAFLRESVMPITEGDIELEDRPEDMEEEDVEPVDLEEEEGAKEKLLSRLIEEKLAQRLSPPENHEDLRRIRRERGLKESSLPIAIQVDGRTISSSLTSESKRDIEEWPEELVTQIENDNGEDE
jgi:hypothetical protein